MTSGQVIAIASVVIALCMVALVILGVTVGLRIQQSEARMSASFVRLRADLTPMIASVTAIAENIMDISGSLRGDVKLIASTVATANERVNQAVTATERRLNEFNALLGVVQDEAEDLFVATASTVHGVRTGAASLRRRGGTDLASDELDEADLDIELEEDGHGDDSDTDQSAQPTATPRVRPRARGRRRA